MRRSYQLPIWTEVIRPQAGGPETPVSIFQREWEFERCLDLYRQAKPKKVLEIGTFYGGTLYHWLGNARPGTTVVSIDSYLAGPDNRQQYPSWCPNEVSVVAIKGDSHAPSTREQAEAHAPYQWLFIDAHHMYGDVAADWSDYSPMVEQGGIVCFHDIVSNDAGHPEIQVKRFWHELQAAGYVTQEITCDLNEDWGGIGVVYL